MDTITNADRTILRDLAKQQSEYANTPENIARNRAWYAHNDLHTPPIAPRVTIEEWTFAHEIKRPLLCETEQARAFEAQLRGHITTREDINDDRATPDFFTVWRGSWFKPFGLEAKQKHLPGSLAYEFVPVVHDFAKDAEKLGRSAWSIAEDTPGLALAEDVLGDILPVRVVSNYPSGGLSQMLVHFMSLETMMYGMMDCPTLFHTLMNNLTEDLLAFYTECENTGAYITNNTNTPVAQGSYAHNTQFPAAQKAKTAQMWGYFDSQETSAISPRMYEEFFFPYYKRLMDVCGWVNYACCEPVHLIWENCLRHCPNIRKLSISPWCDEVYMGEVLRGSDVIYHRKPSPNLVGAAGFFDEAAYKAHIIETLRAARGCRLEFSLRDIYSLGGEKGRAKRVVALIRHLIELEY
jgi:hypothetical protein